MGNPDVRTMKEMYAAWKAARAQDAAPEEALGVPQTDFELLRAMETHDTAGLSQFASFMGTHLGQSLWGVTVPEFAEAMALHVTRFCDRQDACERVWLAVDGMREHPDKYADAVLDRMFSWVAALLPEGQRKGEIFRAFTRDVLLEVALAEAVKYELATSRPDSPALRGFREFVRAKMILLVPPQDRDEITAQVEEGLLGFGQAGVWGKRKTIQQFDRSKSSLAAFVMKPVHYLLADAHAPIYFHVTSDTLRILEQGGFEGEGLGALVDKSWQTWHGLETALLAAAPQLSAPASKPWLNRVRSEAGVFEARGRGMPAEDKDDPVNEIADTCAGAEADEFEALTEIVLDADRFEVFLERWRELVAPERMRLSKKFMLLKTVVLRDSIDEVNGAHSAADGTAQLKFVFVQGISTLVMGVSGGETPHLGSNASADETTPDEMITRAGFFADKLAELGVKQLGKAAWDLWRIIYTISFISALSQVDESTAQVLASVTGSRDEREGGGRIPLGWLAAHAIMKGAEKDLSRGRIIDLVRQYGQALLPFLGSQEPAPAGATALEINTESDSIVARVVYPQVLLASYAPNAFATLYWNIHQGERLGIDKMRSKLKDLRVSLKSLRRFLYEDVLAE